MPTRKIADLPEDKTCRHPEHEPPKHMVFPSGVYEHECPACGHKRVFTSRPGATLGSLTPPRGAFQLWRRILPPPLLDVVGSPATGAQSDTCNRE